MHPETIVHQHLLLLLSLSFSFHIPPRFSPFHSFSVFSYSVWFNYLLKFVVNEALFGGYFFRILVLRVQLRFWLSFLIKYMQFFRKFLLESDLSETLSFPSESLKVFELPDEDDDVGANANHSMEFEAEDAMGRHWPFWLTIQPRSTPVLTSGWSLFVSQKGLRPGDVVTFCKKEDGIRGGSPFIIEVQKVNTLQNVRTFFLVFHFILKP